MGFLDETGLARVWNKVKALIPTKTSELQNDSGFLTQHQDISGKQDILVSGTNIKTINNQSVLGAGNISVPSPTDYIVEWGASGIWNYIKYNSGFCECFGLTAAASAATTVAYGNGYYATKTQNLPSGLFKGIGNVQCTAYAGDKGLVNVVPYTVTTSSVKYYVINTRSETINNFRASILVKGGWK